MTNKRKKLGIGSVDCLNMQLQNRLQWLDCPLKVLVFDTDTFYNVQQKVKLQNLCLTRDGCYIALLKAARIR